MRHTNFATRLDQPSLGTEFGQSENAAGFAPPVGRATIARILVIGEDVHMRQQLIDYFAQHDLAATALASRQDLGRVFACGDPSLIILDLRPGQDDGFDLLREIRAVSDVPVIITTGQSSDEVDRIVGLELGADDHMTKPFSLRELLARVRAVLRRREIGRQATVKREPERGVYRFEGWRLERRSRRLFDPEGGQVVLTKGEYALLLAFLGAPQRPLSREQLLQATRLHEDVFDRSIDVQVLRLRRKLGRDQGGASFIRTERGIGYVFAVGVHTN